MDGLALAAPVGRGSPAEQGKAPPSGEALPDDQLGKRVRGPARLSSDSTPATPPARLRAERPLAPRSWHRTASPLKPPCGQRAPARLGYSSVRAAQTFQQYAPRATLTPTTEAAIVEP